MYKIWLNLKSGSSRDWFPVQSSNLKPYLYESYDHARWSCNSLYPNMVYGEDIWASQEKPDFPAGEIEEDPFKYTVCYP